MCDVLQNHTLSECHKVLHANTSATCSAEHTMDLNTHMHALTNGIPLSVQPVQARSLTHLYLSTTRTV